MINGELLVDNFAGGGGASTGIEMATGVSVDIAINHDPEAIRMHKTNHPNTKHYCENVYDVDPVKACEGHPVGLVTSFLSKYYDGGYKGAGADIKNPLPAVTTIDHNNLCAETLIQMNNHCDGRDISAPLPTITAGDGHFGEVRAFLIKYYGEDTVTTKDRFGLVTVNGVDYQIVDIGLRMLEPRELYGCQSFPDDYIIDHDYTGKQYPRNLQVARCGNSVPPKLSEALVRANLPEMCSRKRMPNLKIETEATGQLRFA